VTKGNNMLDVPYSIVDGFLLRDIFVSSIQLNMPLWSKARVSTLENPDGQAVFLSKTDSLLTGKQCARFPTFKQR
jgi:hypothetical protein